MANQPRRLSGLVADRQRKYGESQLGGAGQAAGPSVGRAEPAPFGESGCPICGGLGVAKWNVPPGDERFGKIFDCECRVASPDHRARLLRAAGYPESTREEWATWKLDALRGVKGKQEAYRGARALLAARSGLLLLHGVYSMGKTGVLVALCNACIDLGLTARYIRAQDLLDEISATYTPDATLTVEDVQARYARIHCLAVDELEKVSGSDHAKAAVFRMLDERYNRRTRQATALASNASLQDLAKSSYGYVVARWSDGIQAEMTGAELRGPAGAKVLQYRSRAN